MVPVSSFMATPYKTASKMPTRFIHLQVFGPSYYGAPIYGLAPHPQLTLLVTIQNFAIRICTGAFYTSPALSLCAESGLPPLHY